MMLLQEPVQAAIWDALNNYSYHDAIFLAERLYAEISNNESLHLLATCYYRAGHPSQAYMLLNKASLQTPQCKFLKAKCCSELNKYNEVEQILAGTILTKIKSYEDIEAEFGSLACYVFALLGSMYSKTDREKKACQCYRRSLTLNPLLWKSYEALCHLGEDLKADAVFQIPSHPGGVVDTSAPTPSLAVDPIASGDPQQCQHGLPQQQQLSSSIDHSSSTNTTFSIAPTEKFLSPRNIYPNKTPENLGPPPAPHPHLPDPSKAPRPNKQRAVLPSSQILRRSKLFSNPAHVSPSFGVLPVESPPQMPGSATPSFISPIPSETQALEVQAPIKTRPMTRRTQMGKSPVLNWSNTLRKINEKEMGNAPIRRSSRLFTNSNSNSSAVKENNKSQTQSSLAGTRGVNRRSKRTPKSQEELNEINKGELTVDTKPSAGNDALEQIMQMQQQSLAGILHLLRNIGLAYSALASYDCRAAIDLFMELPEHHYNTGWVLCQVGRAYYELTEYQRAARVFEEVRRLEPYHLEGLEFYSSVLWQLHKEVELSLLAQELTAVDKKSPQAWFATGNCFSLQKEHDVAIKFFQRAIQVDPNFVYAYSLLAMEYNYLEEFDKALTCFRNAIRLDKRHYQAWYGVGLIYYKQEKFKYAEEHYRKALSINPLSSVLMCSMGVAQHAQHKTDQALNTLTCAIQADPKNPLCMFHRASILFASDRHKEALEELEALKEIIPRESLVYFLMGNVQKKLGNTHLAMMNFSWAMDLDPKGLNNQIKEAVNKRYVTEDDDPLARLEADSALEADGAAALDGGDLDSVEASPEESSSSRVGGAGVGDLGAPIAGPAVGGLLHVPDLQALESDESL